ncbi:MAG: adenylate/guanylate cyclase domain-containing protein [Thermoguttaceae bacterium]
MAFADDIRKEVKQIMGTTFTERAGTQVPEPEDVKLGNDAVTLEGTVLYADLAESTSMVNNYKNWFAAKVYKSFLLSACRVIRNLEGTITAFDGDRVMAVFIGEGKNSAAAKAALQINWNKSMINEEVKAKYADTTYVLKHVVGVDTSPLFVARTGIRGSNDLVWVGRSANYAAKLSNVDNGYCSLITKDVYDKLNKGSKIGSNGNNMWTALTWSEYNITIYGSTWHWKPS